MASPATLPRGTLVDLFFEAVERHGAAAAFRYERGGQWQTLRYAEVGERVQRLTRALAELGIEAGDRVALLSENRPEWALTDYACLCLGAIGVPIYATLPAHHVAYLLEHSGARLIFVSDAEQLDKVRQIRSDAPALSRIIVFDDLATQDPDVVTFSQLLERASPGGEDFRAFRERARRASPVDTATIINTTGTTGTPKGVMLTHNNIYSNVRAALQLLPMSSTDVTLSFLPLSHIFERMVDYAYFYSGAVIAHVGSFDDVARSMQEVRPTIVASVPRLYEKIYARVMAASGLKRRLLSWARGVGEARATALLAGRAPTVLTRLQFPLADRLVFRKLRARTGGRLRFFISGGAPLEPAIARFFYSAGLLILEGYGLTETSPVTNVNTPAALKIGTVGRPVPGTEEMIADDGEILVRGPQVMKGYYRNDEATRQAIDSDSWFHTGDVGAFDADGFLRITDRKKDLIVTAGGKNIAPQPIENRVKTNAFVAEAVMIGDRRPFPVLLVVPDFDAVRTWAAGLGIDAGEPAVLTRDPRVREKLESEVQAVLEPFAGFERPKKIALLADEFSVAGGELTPSMKVKRGVIEERYRELIDALYA